MSAPVTVSVVTVVRNDLEGLRKTVQSVAVQTYSNIQQVVIDGASTDGTAEWIKANPQPFWSPAISEPDAGIYDAMNKALRFVNGDLIVFMNAGDTFHESETVMRVARHWGRHHWKWAYGGVRWTRDAVVVADVHKSPYSLSAFAAGRLWIPHQSTYFTRTVLDAIGPFDTSFGIGADQELIMRAAKYSDPHIFSYVLSDFALGGAHSQLSLWQREFAWRKMRLAHFPLTRSGRATDFMHTVLRASVRVTRHHSGELVRTIRSRSKAIDSGILG